LTHGFHIGKNPLQIELTAQYPAKSNEPDHIFHQFTQFNLRNAIMSKELNLIDTIVTDAPEVDLQPDLIKLSDLSLALVGGGIADVVF
jgi:hypothetical protein